MALEFKLTTHTKKGGATLVTPLLPDASRIRKWSIWWRAGKEPLLPNLREGCLSVVRGVRLI